MGVAPMASGRMFLQVFQPFIGASDPLFPPYSRTFSNPQMRGDTRGEMASRKQQPFVEGVFEVYFSWGDSFRFHE